jgi:hypothetical protein
MIKLAFKLIFLLVGFGAGIYVGVHFPAFAGQVSTVEDAKIKQAVAQAKIDILNQVVADQKAKASSPANLISGASGLLGGGTPAPDPTTAKYQAMLEQSKSDLATANATIKP